MTDSGRDGRRERKTFRGERERERTQSQQVPGEDEKLGKLR